MPTQKEKKPALKIYAFLLAILLLAACAPATPTPLPVAGDVTVSAKDGMKLHYVPAGPFKMGSETYGNEKPIHEVTLDAFWIDESEVTNQMYALCVKDGKCEPPSNKGSYTRGSYYDNAQYADYPVVWVSWNDATDYCKWAGRALPSEAQWEKAARWKPSPSGGGQGGGESLIYPWGDDAPNKDLLNYRRNIGDTTKVGSYSNGKSFYGAQDMAGNVWEWVNDWFGLSYYAASPASNPPGPAFGSGRIQRGGSWDSFETYIRSADREYDYPTDRLLNIGFRCALVVAKDEG